MSQDMVGLGAGVVRCSAAVRQALAGGKPTVALETTIFSELGLPTPRNREALDRVVETLNARGVEPAITAVIEGEVWCGLEPSLHDRICGPAAKVAAHDLGLAVARRVGYGATTVSASLTVAAAVGLRVFATGGIGGVHRGVERTGDISADLGAIARWPVITVTAGAKAFLDLARTVEHLETLSVPILGWQCDEFPAFYSRFSGLPLSQRVETAAEVADTARAHWSLGGGGIVVACPIPAGAAIGARELEGWISQALNEIGLTPDQASRGGAEVTPAVLERLAALSDGRTVEANLALADNNARVAAAIARALSE